MSAPMNTPSTGPTYLALTGNPNCGKTTLFNALTGLRAKVGNYAGVTVERKEGRLQAAPAGMDLRVVDLPGTYSLAPQSVDEQVSRDVLLNRLPELPAPALIVIVVDASNLQRNLYYATQVIELGRRTVIALNMIDVAEANGHTIDAHALAHKLGVPVVPIVASINCGLAELRSAMVASLQKPAPAEPKTFCPLLRELETEVAALAKQLSSATKLPTARARAEALLVLTNERVLASDNSGYAAPITEAVAAARARLDAANVDWRGSPIEARYGCVAAIQTSVTVEAGTDGENLSDRLDRVLTHKIWGTLIFVAIMALMFQSIFTFAKYPMDGLQACVDWVAALIHRGIPPGDLNSLLADGVVAGVGAVIVFLPQILLLFLFIGFLEDTGYMARAAFLMDRVMSKVGLHGKSFIPMLSSYACAIPGIMATRTIETPKDRLVTILVAPLMSCSARLPVYTVLIAACIPDIKVLGFLKLAGLTMLAMYLLGTGVALVMAWIFKKTLLRGETPMLIMELPPYKMPVFKVVLRHMWDRSRLFLRRAGTVILGINILLWFLATYPKDSAATKQFEENQIKVAKELLVGQFHYDNPTLANIHAIEYKASIMGTNSELIPFIERMDLIKTEFAGEQLRHSFAGRIGRLIEPVIAPLGFDWKMGIGIVASFAAREVFVSTMATVYNVGQSDDSDSSTKNLAKTLQAQTRPDGTRIYTTLTGLTLMVFYVFALQCVSTVAVVRRETNSWKWPIFQWLYMGALAWGLAFAARHLGMLFGLS